MPGSLQGQVKLPWRDFLSPWNLQKEAGWFSGCGGLQTSRGLELLV